MSHTSGEIQAKADGNGRTAIPLKYEMDSTVGRSMMTVERARASGGHRTPVANGEKIKIVDSCGRSYNCVEKIKLRWWQEGASCSYSEDFYIVNDCGAGVDAILRGDLQALFLARRDSHLPDARPLQLPVQTQGI